MSIRLIKRRIKEEFSKKLNPYSEIIKGYDQYIGIENIKNLSNLVLEIGCGSGRFLSAYSKDENRNYLGIDIRYKRLVYALEKSKDTKNLFWTRNRAEEVLNSIEDNSLEEVHIYFPDPWPKKKHLKNRFLNVDNLKLISKKLKKDGRFFFKSDHKEYFDWAKINIEKVFNLKIVTNNLKTETDEGFYDLINYKTEFEGLFESKNIKINALIASQLS